MKKAFHLAIGLGLLAAANAGADEDDLGWSGMGEFGAVLARGNTVTENIALGLDFMYNTEKWRHEFGLDALLSSQEDVDTAERYEFTGSSDRKLTDISYVFASLRLLKDEFSEFDTQATAALGYGRELIDNDIHDLDAEIGLGVRRSELRSNSDTNTEAILRLSLDYAWAISESASLTNKLLIEAGSDNTFGKNETALNTRVNDQFGVKVGYEVRHNTDVAEPLENSDFLTTVNLIYNFE